jgi:uncharacterized protein (UPF0276 family)
MKYGLGWRRELGTSILANLDRIDVVEVMAEDFFCATKDQQRALRFLAQQVTVVLHATSLGLASTEPVDSRRMDQVARVVEWLEPHFWSEHLAFVRGGGFEVGHLAAPPRNDATLAGLVRNVETAERITGSRPLLENVASLIEPPACAYDEAGWLHAVLDATTCDLLLDLHNVYANGVNFGFDAASVVSILPADRIRAIHLAGGKRIERNRLLDDHKHAVPDEIYELLALVTNPDAFILLERDGEYPPFEELLEELERARAVVPRFTPPSAVAPPREAIASEDTIARLAQLYVDASARDAFLANPEFALDAEDLALAVRSFERKRAGV